MRPENYFFIQSLLREISFLNMVLRTKRRQFGKKFLLFLEKEEEAT